MGIGGLALAAERGIVHRAVASVRPAAGLPGGWVLHHPALPDIWHLNRVHLTGAAPPGSSAGALAARVDRLLAGAPHRRVTLDDETAAGALWPSFEAGGWRRECSVVMALADGVAPPAPAGSRVRALDEPGLRAFQERAFADDAFVTAISTELPARLAAAQSLLRAGTDWRGLGIAAVGDADGCPGCAATVYLDSDVDGRRVAFIDQLATLRPHREQGLARTVMSAALAAATDWGADLVALFAAGDDWPQIFYARLGFTIVARQVSFHQDSPPGPRR